MKYERIREGRFLTRPNRFLAHVEIDGREEIVHVKNTGRCAELLCPGVSVYVQESEHLSRKTKWDLIGVKKGQRIINIDSQIPNYVVKEWIEKGNLFSNIKTLRPETVYGNSRFDLYIEYEEKRAFIEVKGVTLEEEGVALFPDAPSDRAVKHVEELMKAAEEGYEVYLFFVIQMKGVRYVTPNRRMHQKFAQVLSKAAEKGVKILAYDCKVTETSIDIADSVPVITQNPELYEMTEPLVTWYRENKRDLPWRHHISAYRVWVSEIMLQQTRVEAVKPFYTRFLKELPTVYDLADAKEDKLLKLWEGLGYYNRVRNMHKAAKQIVEQYQGEFPQTYEQIRELTGIGNYTAGAIASFAFGEAVPAVDGNVLRVISRILASEEDVMKASVRSKIEYLLKAVIPADHPSDFNQGLIELGALVCVPNGSPKCEDCPVAELCRAREMGKQDQLPVRKKAKKRRIEKRTVFIFKDGGKVAIKKRPQKGLLAGMYEFPNLQGHLTQDEVVEYSKSIGLAPVYVKQLPDVQHIFSHVEWHMIGYVVLVDELEKHCADPMIFAYREEIKEKYSIPSAFEAYSHFSV